MPTISVIVPVYKVEPWLRRCADSVLAQRFSDFELILVDDGSPDRCGDICDEYAQKDPRVHVIHQKNGGLSAARNAGIDWAFANSDSQWLTFVDSDDWLHPETLTLLHEAAVHWQVKVSVCGYYRATETTMPVLANSDRLVSLSAPEAFWCLKYINATIACGKLYKKEVFRSLRYPVGKLHEDEYITYRILFAEKQIAVMTAPLYCYFQNDFSIMRSNWSLARISGLDAYEEQTRFFAQNGFREAYQFDLRLYTNWCKEKMKMLQEHPDAQDAGKSYKTIRKKLAHYLLRNRKALPFSKNRALYEMAFPNCFYIYHLGGKLLGRHH